MNSPRLVYVTDPMCSWCWGFAPVLERLRETLESRVSWELVLGGLAPDSDEPMPEATRDYVQEAWRAVARATGAAFNWDFWERCVPRRSTYPACRAVVVAESQQPGSGWTMLAALQSAYYLEARNPSLEETLVEVAAQLGFESTAFRHDLLAPATQVRLEEHFARRRSLGADAFPSIAIQREGEAARLLLRGHAPFEEVSARVMRELGD